MRHDIMKEMGGLFLGSRLKRLAERMQADVVRIAAHAGLPIQPSQYPVLVALDRFGPMTIGEIVDALELSQPAITRLVAKLTEVNIVEISRAHRDQRHKTISLTEFGREAMARSKRDVWPKIEAAVNELTTGQSGPLLQQIGAIEDQLSHRSLEQRAMAGPANGLWVREYSDELAGAFHDINAEWITAMFRLEQTDRDVLDNPRERIVDAGGVILFAEARDLGVVGTCALRKTGESSFELTKMGVLESARGRKVGEFLLDAVLRRAEQLEIETLYLLTSSICAPAIHLYEKLGFVHDAGIMRDYGARYERCDVAMLYRP